MGVKNDFLLWERELGDLGEAAPPTEAASPAESPGKRTMVLTAVLLVAGCALLIVLGQVVLGAVALVVSALILTLWSVGM